MHEVHLGWGSIATKKLQVSLDFSFPVHVMSDFQEYRPNESLKVSATRDCASLTLKSPTF